jgi:S1-C subfamily serine protease
MMQPFDRQDVPPVPQPSPQGATSPSRQSRRPSRWSNDGWKLLVRLVLLVAVFGTGLLAGCQLGGGNTATSNSASSTGGGTPIPSLGSTNIQTVREAVIARVQPAVVQINVTTGQGGGLGSGVIIDQRGYIITNNHVVEGAQRAEVVLYGGATLPAQIVGTDPPDDLAVVKVTPPKTNLTVATLGNSSQVRVGQDVLAIGNPLGITQTVTNGIVSALDRTVGTIPDAIQTDAPINPGNSGGALVDLQGNVIGIPTATAIDPQFKTPANGVGFAVPSNRVKFIAPQLIQTGRVTNSGRAALGVGVVTVDPSLATQNGLAVDHGVLIASVTSGGPAAQAGLRPGDVIVQMDGKAVNDVPSLGDILLSKKPGDTVSVQFYRGSQQQTVQVRLGELKIG